MDVGAELKLVHNKVSVLQSPEFRTCIFEIFPPSVWSEEGCLAGAGAGLGGRVSGDLTYLFVLKLGWGRAQLFHRSATLGGCIVFSPQSPIHSSYVAFMRDCNMVRDIYCQHCLGVLGQERQICG